MKKALILANSSAGLYDFRNEILTGLSDEGYEVVISLPDELKIKELKEEGFRIEHTEINRRGVNPIQDMALFRAYKALIKKEKPDIVLTYTINPTIYGGFACRRLKVPYISTVTGLGTTFERGGILLKLIVTLYKVALKDCRCLFFQNEENRKKFEDCGIRARKHITVNGSGVNLQKHYPEDYPGHKDDITRFLYIGRIMKEKGMDEYLEAARIISSRYPGKVSFAAVGYFDDDYEMRIKEAEKAHYFKRIPFAQNIHPYIREADAIVHPSYHEGMSNVLMEASATARPVIASNISGCKEIVEDGVSGILFEPRSLDALTKALSMFMEMDTEHRREMGRAARRHVEQKFDRRSIILTYINEINKIAE